MLISYVDLNTRKISSQAFSVNLLSCNIYTCLLEPPYCFVFMLILNTHTQHMHKIKNWEHSREIATPHMVGKSNSLYIFLINLQNILWTTLLIKKIFFAAFKKAQFSW